MNIYTANQYIKDTFGEKLYKLSLNAGTTCPNRDGTAGIGGCIFCSSLGSGDFSPKADMDSVVLPMREHQYSIIGRDMVKVVSESDGSIRSCRMFRTTSSTAVMQRTLTHRWESAPASWIV